MLQALKIQRAEDIGRKAWQKGATQEGNKQVSFVMERMALPRD